MGVLGEGFHCIAESNRMQAKDLAFVIGGIRAFNV